MRQLSSILCPATPGCEDEFEPAVVMTVDPDHSSPSHCSGDCPKAGYPQEQ